MDLFNRLSSHRLGEELIHMFSESHPEKNFRRIKDFGLVSFIHPKLEWNARIDSLFQSIKDILTWHRLEFPNEPLKPWSLFAMAFFEPLGHKEVLKVRRKLGFPERLSRITSNFFKEQSPLLRSLFRAKVSRAEIHTLLNPWTLEHVLFLMAKSQVQGSKKLGLQRIREFLADIRHIKLSITGHDLETLHLRKGPAYRRILDQIFQARLNLAVQTKEEELTLAKSLVIKEQRSSKTRRKR